MKKLFFSLVLMCSLVQVQAQTFCDSLDFKIGFHPFYDSLIEVRLTNHSQKMYSYPSFIIKNGSDTIAIEQPDFFALMSTSSHALAIKPGRVPGRTVGGTLSLYTEMYDTLRCTWQLSDVNLCPDSCEEAIVYLGNMGGALFTGTANYQLKDANMQVVKSGTFTITPTEQMDADTFCLYPGSYTMHLSQIALTGGGAKYYGVIAGWPTAIAPAPVWPYNSTADTSFAFNFYKRCASPASVNNVVNNQALYNAFVKGGQMHVEGISGRPLGVIELYAVDGRTVLRANTSSSQYTGDVRHLPSGIYILQVGQQNRAYSQKLYIGNE